MMISSPMIRRDDIGIQWHRRLPSPVEGTHHGNVLDLVERVRGVAER